MKGLFYHKKPPEESPGVSSPKCPQECGNSWNPEPGTLADTFGRSKESEINDLEAQVDSQLDKARASGDFDDYQLMMHEKNCIRKWRNCEIEKSECPPTRLCVDLKARMPTEKEAQQQYGQAYEALSREAKMPRNEVIKNKRMLNCAIKRIEEC